MTLRKRLDRLEGARGAQPDPLADAAFARFAAMLDELVAAQGTGAEAEARAVLRAATGCELVHAP